MIVSWFQLCIRHTSHVNSQSVALPWGQQPDDWHGYTMSYVYYSFIVIFMFPCDSEIALRTAIPIFVISLEKKKNVLGRGRLWNRPTNILIYQLFVFCLCIHEVYLVTSSVFLVSLLKKLIWLPGIRFCLSIQEAYLVTKSILLASLQKMHIYF